MRVSTKGTLCTAHDDRVWPGIRTSVPRSARWPRARAFPIKYLEQIVSTSSQSRLVRSIRGAQGGLYALPESRRNIPSA